MVGGITASTPSRLKKRRAWLNDRVAIIDVTGLIINADKAGFLSTGENPVSVLKEKLELAKADSRVKAVILRINSPGGGVTASDIMYREIVRFRERKPALSAFTIRPVTSMIPLTRSWKPALLFSTVMVWRL